ncbi:bifunctional hydroxymethylpyrimidine kinase/phosphomethylpyrimidine kinase [Fructilactobacillus fructivorans]|uniref:Hydroxymethylpyrimidine/phosphomethylpyrimidine kinase n=1 Tax=Fructilactobacillus fructivorans TaxID=1614 RepID=A0A0C1Q2C4_9LACO|nr:bifunctional hydroxymethylpyrimidine kinase/phosphomethylpyrimidine kinase [Fructilactobacillus fructivorans]KID41963.1 Hydroxymethylpyrimidine phosphate kinase ThiD [Fructilactobacillus fructivorans]MCT0151621.1 bifunctional hydroxymethylpyrimidine kinase/phosphomethylpyrimidine kinase [Fructilactobacillus fructivorans]MCT2867250.1 bifunctional hydroxymethylpyrimidine kinase/phosphomethylpyrimidine kinase [Fructilactobacillus fructivorans]MCT2868189.1 bifunctional hydroxymethylpyrimidine ki
MTKDYPQAVTIAGSDSDGSAGIQADLETFFARRVYGASIITACVSGNSYGIHDSVNMPTSFIDQEFKDLGDDFHILAAKTGMLSDANIINTVVKDYQLYDFGPLVVDPVITTKFGTMLLEEDAFDAMKNELVPMATVLTPNFFEAQKLTGLDVDDPDFMAKSAKAMQDMGASNVIVKGRHDDPSQTKVSDYVLLEDGQHFNLNGPYFTTDRKNGTGDTLSAGITAELAKGHTVADSIKIAKQYVDGAIEDEIQVGHKYGPINHWAR